MRLGAALIAVPAFALALSSCATTPAAQEEIASEQASVETLPASELMALIAAGEVVLIDVRTPEEFAAGRLPGALNAPLQTFVPASIPIEAERETILYCGSSRRSGIAAEQLASYLGTRVRHLEGGIQAWDAAGGEVITSPES
ncbi:rhodanese-like domain-containing protein [Aurantiacibacter sp. MUD61]|uniref:rhodanese-like domain-containing protein n=1 Tax=Aurantiacibacter sp. MUD61 TaxID=3009083 RepID=UPI0022F0CACC|nr:rhodanese-like domain-containing protein [Aurantiacibacter sp. MUD61]